MSHVKGVFRGTVDSDEDEDRDPIEDLRRKFQSLSKEEAVDLLAQAAFHLRCVSGSRNSFSGRTQEAWRKAGLGFPERNREVETMHHLAAEFVQRHDL